MKYKRLSTEELQILEKEFINFLASAQITAQDWEKMKNNETGKAEELIDVFSDVVYDKVLGKISYVEYRDTKTLNIFCFKENTIQLVGLRVKENSPLNLTAPDVLSQWNSNNNSAVNIIKSEKPYTKERKFEIFEMLQNGCLISNEHLFNLLNEI